MTDEKKPVAAPPGQGKVDFKRLEAAREGRKEQVEKWKQYDEMMTRVEAAEQRYRNQRPYMNFEDKYLLIDAALRNDLNDTRALLQSGVNPNVAKEDGLTALHQACINGCLDLCKLLVANGADVNSRDAEQWTPLHAAATCGYVEICQFLVSANADILAIDADGCMPYDTAEDEETAEVFLQEIERRNITKADVDAVRSIPEKSMMDDILSMYNNGEDINSLDEQGAAPIHIAAACNYVDVTNLLLRLGVDPETPDIESWTPSHIAACWGQLPVLRVLIAHGADLNLTTPSGHTAFTLCESVEIHEQLCEIWDDRDNLKAKMEDPEPRTHRIKRRRSQSSVHRSSIGEKWRLSRSEVMKEVELGLNKVVITPDDTFEDRNQTEHELSPDRYSPPFYPNAPTKNIIAIPDNIGSSVRNNSPSDYENTDNIPSTSSSPRPQDGGHVITIVRDYPKKKEQRPNTQWEPDKPYQQYNDDPDEKWRSRPRTDEDYYPASPGYQGPPYYRTHPAVKDYRNFPSIRKKQPEFRYSGRHGPVDYPENPPQLRDHDNDPDNSRRSEEEPGCAESYSACCKNCTLL